MLAGIRAMPLPGHTNGHSGYLFESANQSLVLVWGVTACPSIFLTSRLNGQNAYRLHSDQDPSLAAITRSRLLDLRQFGEDF